MVLMRSHITVLISWTIGVDKALVRYHFSVFTCRPHLHSAVRRLYFHAKQVLAADAHIHFGKGHAGTFWTIPIFEMLRLCPHLPDELYGCIENTFNSQERRTLPILFQSPDLPRFFSAPRGDPQSNDKFHRGVYR